MDELVVFRKLNRQDMRGIVDLQLKYVDQMMEYQNMQLQVSENAKSWLSIAGYDPQFGARPVKRAIQQYLLSPLSKMIIGGNIRNGEEVLVEAQNQDMTKDPLIITSRPLVKPNGVVSTSTKK